jgi:glutamate--cysteine ligase
LTSIFPEVRLKRFLEMRGADSEPWHRLVALPAFWVGLLYDEPSLDAAWDLVKGWSASQRQQWREEVPRLGLKASIAGRPTSDLAKQCLDLASAALGRRNRRDAAGRDETIYLASIEAFLERGITPAEELVEKFHGPWHGSVEPAFEEQEHR